MSPEPPPASESRRIAVGKITKAHGVRGEVTVLVLSEDPDRFADGASVLLDDGRTLLVESSRSHQGRLLVHFGDITDREIAERLRGSYLFIDRSQLADLGDEAWWPHDLEGCVVTTDADRSLGTLEEVLHTEANDIWVVRDDGEETLIPALREVVLDVDIAAKSIRVREIEGLTTPEG